MRHPDRDSDAVAAAILDQELELVRDAVALVASGSSPQVILGGLRFGEELLERARLTAGASGVRVTPEFGADEAGLSLTISRATDG